MAKDKDRDVWQVPENPVLGVASRGLGALRRGLNYIDLADLPMAAAGMPRAPIGEPEHGVGDLLFGKSPEEVDAWAHGFSPFYENRGAFPQLRPNHYQGILDTALLPASEAVGLAKLGGKLGSKGIAALAGDVAKTGAADLGRRDFLKKSGAVAGAGAAGLAGKEIAKLAEKTEAKQVEKAGVKQGIEAVPITHPKEFIEAMHDAHGDAASRANDYAHEFANDLRHEIFRKEEIHRLINRLAEKHPETVLDRLEPIMKSTRFPSAEEMYHMNALEDELHKLRQDPKYMPYREYIYPYGHDDLRHEMATIPDHPFGRVPDFKAGGSIENTTHDRKLI